MSVTEVSMIHHVGIVIGLIWLLSHFDCCHQFVYIIFFFYLYLVNERYVMRLRKKIRVEERKQANQRRALSDSETVRWLNHAVEKMWPICLEEIVSQKILLPIVPWFLEKYKPWTAKKAVVQQLYMGRNPPIFTEMRILRQTTDDDHLVMELGMNFLTADDMSALLAVKLRRRLGFGMWAKLHLTGIHVEGKVLVGVRFLRGWPFLGRIRVCFVEPPYFQMIVKPISTYGIDVTELPGIAGWLDKLLSMAFEQTLVEPNMLVVDVEKFTSPGSESWFSVDEKEPLAYAKVEVIEASDMKPSDLNGLADPYVRGQLGPYRFKTKIEKKTLAPKWNEEFKIPICSWESPNLLSIEVRDKDHFVDDPLGDCSVSINDFRDGQRHDMWLSLQNIKMGRFRLAITVHGVNAKEANMSCNTETVKTEDSGKPNTNEANHDDPFSLLMLEKSSKLADKFEPVDIEGKHETGIWIHHPGSDVSQIWESRKGKTRVADSKISKGGNHSIESPNSSASGSFRNNESGADENLDGAKLHNSVKKQLRKMSLVFHRTPKGEDQQGREHFVLSPHSNIKSVDATEIGVHFLAEEIHDESMKDKAKGLLKQAGKSARIIKHVLSGKGLREREVYMEESDSSGDESMFSSVHDNDSADQTGTNVLVTGKDVPVDKTAIRNLIS